MKAVAADSTSLHHSLRQKEVDAFTVEIIRNSLWSTCQEMAAVLIRTAHSPIIQFNEDFSTGIFDSSSEMIVQGPGLAAHIIPTEACVREAIDEFGIENLGPGDMVISNDPFRGGTHLPDVAVIAPIHHNDGQVVLFAANRAHWDDIGGMVPGSMTGASTELFQEGLLIPPMKIVERGTVRNDVLKLIVENTRLARARTGDLSAQIGANRAAVANITLLIDRYGLDAVLEAKNEVMRQAEKAARQAIGEMPDGSYEYEDFNDNDGIHPAPLKVRARVTISGDSMVVDFAGSDLAPTGPCKSVRTTTEAAVYATVKSLISPDIAVNHGFFKPIEVRVPEGSYLNPTKPASVCGDTEPMARVQDVIMGIFSEIVPERVVACQYGSINHIMAGGNAATTGEPFVLYEAPCGGIGAMQDLDGPSALAMLMCGDVKNQPIEVLEQSYPVLCTHYGLRRDSGGAGRHRGGLGLERTYTFLVPVSASLISDRCVFRPYGLSGGLDAHPGSWMLDPGTPRERRLAGDLHSKISGVSLPTGTVLRIRTAGGGGYGDPLERDAELVRRDVVAGYVSSAAARAVYGVVLRSSGDSWDIDDRATIAHRMVLAAQRGARYRAPVRCRDSSASNTAWIHPEDLVALGYTSGEWVSLSAHRPVPARVRVVPGEAVASGTVALSSDIWNLLRLDDETPCLLQPQPFVDSGSQDAGP